MKQGLAHQNSRHRGRTPSVIQLPQPRPPITAKRAEPAAAMALPREPEPLVERTEVRTAPSLAHNRQARRKALRAEAKAQRRIGQTPLPPAPAVEAVVEPAILPEPLVAKIEPAPVAMAAEIDGPVPRSRALVAVRPRGFALVAQRLRRLFGLRRVEPSRHASEGALLGQLQTMRADLARLQQSLDRMLEGVAA